MPTLDPTRAVSYSASLQQSNDKGGDASPTGISPTQTDKKVIHGIEVSHNIVYHGWEPGKEYIKNLVLKNVSFKTKKLKFRLVMTTVKKNHVFVVLYFEMFVYSMRIIIMNIYNAPNLVQSPKCLQAQGRRLFIR